MVEGTKFMKKLLLLSLVAGLLGFSSTSGFAQGGGADSGAAANGGGSDIADQPCDPQYWRQISARAWLESEREIMQNQNLIFKPDSVLEYTCFDQFVGISSGQGGDIFVHTDYFGPKIINRGTNESMERALTNVVHQALTTYKGNNFSHTFLGGRVGRANGGFASDEENSNFEQPTKDHKAYACKTMSAIWKAAKCANFVDNDRVDTTDGFYPFDALKPHTVTTTNSAGSTTTSTGDPVAGYSDTIQETRRWPANLSCAGNSSAPAGGANTAARLGAGASEDQGAAGTWSDQLKLAENKGQNLYKFQEPLGTIFREVGEKLEPGACGKPAISTGVTVVLQGHKAIDGGESHMDGVCTNPGCTYKKGSLSQAGTCVAE